MVSKYIKGGKSMKFQDFRQQLKEVTNVSAIEEDFNAETEKLLNKILQILENNKSIFQKTTFPEGEMQLFLCISLNPLIVSDNKSEQSDEYKSYNLNVTFAGRCNTGKEYELFDNFDCDDQKLCFKNRIFLVKERYEKESDELSGTFQKYQQVWLEDYLQYVFKKLGFVTSISKNKYSDIELCSIMLSATIDFHSLLDF